MKLGRATLRMDVPQAADAPARRTVRLTYQFNAGSADEPTWRDLVSADTAVEMSRAAPAGVTVKQDTGRMAFSGFPRKRMRNIETVHMELAPTTP